MAYRATLLNKQVNGNQVSYTLIVRDEGKPTYHFHINIDVASDTLARRVQIRNQAENFCDNEQTFTSKRNRLIAIRDRLIDERARLLELINFWQDRLDRNDVDGV